MKKILLFSGLFLLCFLMKAQETDITVHINAGELKDSLTQEQMQKVVYLTVTGSMNSDDLYLISNQMPELEFLNLRDVELDTIPAKTFYDNRKIGKYILPLHIKYLGDQCFLKAQGEIELTGEFPGLGDKVFDMSKTIDISEDNEYCDKTFYSICSKDGKTFYFGQDIGPSYSMEEGIETIASRAFDNSYIAKVYFPGTLRKIETNAFANTGIWAVTSTPPPDFELIFNSETPPELGENIFSNEIIRHIQRIRVPKGCLKAYLASDPQWAAFKICEDGKNNDDITVYIHTGELIGVLSKVQKQEVKRLTVIGSMNDMDLYQISNYMPLLQTVDLKNVELDTIPEKAFYRTHINRFILPLNLLYLGDHSFDESNVSLVVTGKFPGLGEGVIRFGLPMFISPDNEQCKTIDESIYSSDGKIMYHYNFKQLEAEIAQGTEIIASRAFERAGICQLIYPVSLKKIETMVFHEAIINGIVGSYSGRPNMIFKSQEPPVLEDKVFTENEIFKTFYIVVPVGSRNKYKESDPQWSVFNIYEEGEEIRESIGRNMNQDLTISELDHSWLLKGEKIMRGADLFDSVGKSVASVSCNGTEVTIPFPSGCKGIYYANIFYSDHTFETVKLIY